MRKLFVLLFVFLLLTSFSGAFGEVQTNIAVNGETVEFDDDMGVPFIDENGRTQVPFRIILEKIGAEVSWDQERYAGVAKKGETTVIVPIGQKYILKNEEKIENDTNSLIKDGRTYLPIRVVMEAFGYKVGWDGDTRTVNIYTEKYQSEKVVSEYMEHYYSNGDLYCGKMKDYKPEGKGIMYYSDGNVLIGEFSHTDGITSGVLYDENGIPLKYNESAANEKSVESEELMKSVVEIKMYSNRGDLINRGFGVVVEPGGLIAVNASYLLGYTQSSTGKTIVQGIGNSNFLEKNNYIKVRMNDGSEYTTSTIISVDQRTDIALIKIYPEKALECAEIGNWQNLSKAEKIFSVSDKVSEGYISGFGYINEMITDLFSTNLLLSETGNGEIIFNSKGELVGIVSEYFMNDNKTVAVPTKYLIKLLSIEQTKTNRYIADNFHEFIYNDTALYFDSKNYQEGGYYINFSQSSDDDTDFNELMKDENFKTEIENAFKYRLSQAAKKFNKNLYYFELKAGDYIMKYSQSVSVGKKGTQRTELSNVVWKERE